MMPPALAPGQVWTPTRTGTRQAIHPRTVLRVVVAMVELRRSDQPGTAAVWWDRRQLYQWIERYGAVCAMTAG